jgi:glycosyltransferase involved in cell wall biosynthesis
MPTASRIANANFVARFIMASLYLLKPNCNRGEYVAFLGRISPEKRPDRALLSLPERRPPGFCKCVQVVREPAEWPTKLIQIKQHTLVPSRLPDRL